MGGRQPKNATWFELSVAASLKTNPYSVGEKSLNLMEYVFDPNPPPYAPDLTGAGYPASIDVIAQKGDSKHHISCKFSQNEDEVLTVRSQAFSDVFLEFVPVLKAEPNIKYRMDFDLATNMRLSQSVEDLFRQPTLDKAHRLSKRVKKRGNSKYKSRFNSSLFDEETLSQMVNRTAILRFTVRELENLHESNDSFQKAFESISKSLVRTPKMGLGLIGVRSPDILFNCHAEVHERCTEVVVDGLFCHFGDLKPFSEHLQERVAHLDKTEVTLIPSLMAPFLDRKKLVLSEKVSTLKACNVLTKALNLHRLLAFPENVGFFVVPGTWDLVIFDPKRLASELKATQDADFRYHPNRVEELRRLGLGPESLDEITKWAFLLGFKLRIDKTEVLVN